MKLKIPPPLQALIFAVLFWSADYLLPLGGYEFPGRSVIAGMTAGLGFVIAASGVMAFRKAGTTTNPLNPAEASSLVRSGIYRISRNPMYLGLLFALLAWAVWLGNIFNVGGLALFVWYITTFQIKPEEEALRKLFGADYDAYCQETPRWIFI